MPHFLLYFYSLGHNECSTSYLVLFTLWYRGIKTRALCMLDARQACYSSVGVNRMRTVRTGGCSKPREAFEKRSTALHR